MAEERESFEVRLEVEIGLARSLARGVHANPSDDTTCTPELEKSQLKAPSDLLVGHFEEGMRSTEKDESRWRSLGGGALQHMADEKAILQAELKRTALDLSSSESQVLNLTQKVEETTRQLEEMAQKSQGLKTPLLHAGEALLDLAGDEKELEGMDSKTDHVLSRPAWVEELSHLWIETDVQLEKQDKALFDAHETIWRSFEDLHGLSGALLWPSRDHS
jgi:hypothetical protein